MSLSLETTRDSVSWLEERMSEMTCLIYTQNDNYSILCSDTWNTTSNKNKYIQKIALNEKNKIIIGSAGDNSSIYENGVRVQVFDFIQECCDKYDGYNINEIIQLLADKSFTFINDMQFTKTKSVCFVQYFVVWYDMKQQKRCVRKLEVYKEKPNSWCPQFESDINKPIFKEYERNLTNFNCTSFGTYHIYFNSKYYDKSFTYYTKDSLKDFALNELQRQIDYEKDFPINRRSVSGQKHWCIMDNHGNIETNISENLQCKV